MIESLRLPHQKRNQAYKGKKFKIGAGYKALCLGVKFANYPLLDRNSVQQHEPARVGATVHLIMFLPWIRRDSHIRGLQRTKKNLEMLVITSSKASLKSIFRIQFFLSEGAWVCLTDSRLTGRGSASSGVLEYSGCCTWQWLMGKWLAWVPCLEMTFSSMKRAEATVNYICRYLCFWVQRCGKL